MSKTAMFLVALLVLVPSLCWGASSYTAESLTVAHIQTAVESCESAGDCTQVNLPAGEITWNAGEVDLDIPTGRSITINGAGRTATIITLNYSTRAFNVNNVGPEQAAFFGLQNLELKGADGVKGVGVEMRRVENFLITKVNFNNLYPGTNLQL